MLHFFFEPKPKRLSQEHKNINNPIQSGILANTEWATNSKFDLQITLHKSKTWG